MFGRAAGDGMRVVNAAAWPRSGLQPVKPWGNRHRAEEHTWRNAMKVLGTAKPALVPAIGWGSVGFRAADKVAFLKPRCPASNPYSVLMGSTGGPSSMGKLFLSRPRMFHLDGTQHQGLARG